MEQGDIRQQAREQFGLPLAWRVGAGAPDGATPGSRVVSLVARGGAKTASRAPLGRGAHATVIYPSFFWRDSARVRIFFQFQNYAELG